MVGECGTEGVVGAQPQPPTPFHSVQSHAPSQRGGGRHVGRTHVLCSRSTLSPHALRTVGRVDGEVQGLRIGVVGTVSGVWLCMVLKVYGCVWLLRCMVVFGCRSVWLCMVVKAYGCVWFVRCMVVYG